MVRRAEPLIFMMAALPCDWGIAMKQARLAAIRPEATVREVFIFLLVVFHVLSRGPTFTHSHLSCWVGKWVSCHHAVFLCHLGQTFGANAPSWPGIPVATRLDAV